MQVYAQALMYVILMLTHIYIYIYIDTIYTYSQCHHPTKLKHHLWLICLHTSPVRQQLLKVHALVQ